MTRKLLILVVVLGLTALASPPAAQARACRSQVYCNYCGTPAMTGSLGCCCPAGTAGAGQITTCEDYQLGSCNDFW